EQLRRAIKDWMREAWRGSGKTQQILAELMGQPRCAGICIDATACDPADRQVTGSPGRAGAWRQDHGTPGRSSFGRSERAVPALRERRDRWCGHLAGDGWNQPVD